MFGPIKPTDTNATNSFCVVYVCGSLENDSTETYVSNQAPVAKEALGSLRRITKQISNCFENLLRASPIVWQCHIIFNTWEANFNIQLFKIESYIAWFFSLTWYQMIASMKIFFC